MYEKVCLTSNLKCETVSSLQDHHIVEIIKHGLPYVLCTDDKGMLSSPLLSLFSQLTPDLQGKSSLYVII